MEGILVLANYWKILELQINVKLDVEGLQICLLPMEKTIQTKISNGPQMDLKWTSNEPLWDPHGKPPLCTYMIELKHLSVMVPI